MLKLSDFYKSVFGCKTYKISLDASCTCPNRDGTKGTGGCIFCSQNGSGDFTPEKTKTISEQVEEAKSRIEQKLRGRSGKRKGKYIAYFQNFTSTYGNAEELEKKYLEALSCEDVAGLAVATRPDCVSDGILEIIKRISEKYFVQIELGLQTSNEQTGKMINRCYTDSDYADAVKRIKAANPKIHVVTHLIFGLPEEMEEDMMRSVDFVVKVNNSTQINAGKKDENGALQPAAEESCFGIKITSLYVLRNTRLYEMYENGEYEPLSKERYFEFLEKALSHLPENTVVHRLTGDPPKSILAAPLWPADKKRVLNEINKIVEEDM